MVASRPEPVSSVSRRWYCASIAHNTTRSYDYEIVLTVHAGSCAEEIYVEIFKVVPYRSVFIGSEL